MPDTGDVPFPELHTAAVCITDYAGAVIDTAINDIKLATRTYVFTSRFVIGRAISRRAGERGIPFVTSCHWVCLHNLLNLSEGHSGPAAFCYHYRSGTAAIQVWAGSDTSQLPVKAMVPSQGHAVHHQHCAEEKHV